MSDDYSRSVGLFIRNKREAISLSQVDCSKVSDIARSTLRDLEQGKRLPNGKELISLSAVLKTTPNAILAASDKDNSFSVPVKRSANNIDMITSYAQLLYAFGSLSKNSKELIKNIVFQLACGDLPSAKRAQFIETYSKNIPIGLLDTFNQLPDGLDETFLVGLEGALISFENGAPLIESLMNEIGKAMGDSDLKESAAANCSSRKQSAANIDDYYEGENT